MVTLTLFSINNDKKIRSIHVYILLQVGIFMGYVFFVMCICFFNIDTELLYYKN